MANQKSCVSLTLLEKVNPIWFTFSSWPDSIALHANMPKNHHMRRFCFLHIESTIFCTLSYFRKIYSENDMIFPFSLMCLRTQFHGNGLGGFRYFVNQFRQAIFLKSCFNPSHTNTGYYLTFTIEYRCTHRFCIILKFR